MKRLLVLVALLATSSAFANDVDPFGFEKEHFQTSTSRAVVSADLKAAQAAGELPIGELGVKPQDVKSVKARAQVVAETLEAARLGLLSHYGEQEPKQATQEQERQIQVAGLRAIGLATASR